MLVFQTLDHFSMPQAPVTFSLCVFRLSLSPPSSPVTASISVTRLSLWPMQSWSSPEMTDQPGTGKNARPAPRLKNILDSTRYPAHFSGAGANRNPVPPRAMPVIRKITSCSSGDRRRKGGVIGEEKPPPESLNQPEAMRLQSDVPPWQGCLCDDGMRCATLPGRRKHRVCSVQGNRRCRDARLLVRGGKKGSW